MGLDIYHLKATLTPDDSADPLYLEPTFPKEFEEYGFGAYVQPIATVRVVYTAVFCEDEEDFKDAKTGAAADRSYWPGKPEAHTAALRDIERRLGLDAASASRLGSRTRGNDRWLDRVSIIYSEPTTEPGLHVVEVGYQRKGMSPEFYERYERTGIGIYVREEDFTDLPRFVLPEWRDELLPDLHRNFIENYERGKSILLLSA